MKVLLIARERKRMKMSCLVERLRLRFLISDIDIGKRNEIRAALRCPPRLT